METARGRALEIGIVTTLDLKGKGGGVRPEPRGREGWGKGPLAGLTSQREVSTLTIPYCSPRKLEGRELLVPSIRVSLQGHGHRGVRGERSPVASEDLQDQQRISC